MKTKHFYGTTEENDTLSLPEGMLSVDGEKKALRFHLEGVPGGYEILGTQAVPILYGPGPQTLQAGTMDAGFFGEVTSAELLTYVALAAQIGLSAGTSQFNAESLWLKFALDNKILYVAKKPARHSISWNHISTANAVYEGGSQISVGSHTLEVTLLRGASSDPTTDATGYDIVTSHGSEWNRLMYPIHSGTHTTASNPTAHTDPTAAPFGSWASYSDADLRIHRDLSNGGSSWIQETPASTSNRVTRGNYGVSLLQRSPATTASSFSGWRPVLRLIT